MAFLPLGRGWAVTMCVPSNAHLSAPSWHLEQWDLPPPWHQSCHPSTQHAGTHCSCVPCQPCCWTTHSLCQPARGTQTSPRVLLLPHPQPVLAPLRCNTNHPVLQDIGSPKTLPTFSGGSIACTPNYLRPWGRGAAWGSQWQWVLGDSGTTLGQIHLSPLYLSQAWVEGPLQCPK